jgi:alanine racemase
VTVTLTVQRESWEAGIASTVRAYAPAAVIPVVKGNGYGFGRTTLFPIAAGISPWVCVGTVEELVGVPEGVTAVVLTPAPTTDLPRSRHARFVVTCGNRHDMNGLGEGDRVALKLESSMRRYGVAPDGLGELLRAADRQGVEVIAASIHLPLAGDEAARLGEVNAWVAHLPAGLPLWVSHLAPESVIRLNDTAERDVAVRLGTALWHGDKSLLHLGATVVATRAVRAGERAGYRQVDVPVDGHLVLVGGGSAHGIAALDDGRSPFHFARRRLTLLEAPHMHTSMVVVPEGDPLPEPGDRVDVQRPLTMTNVDRIEWQ